MRYATLSHDGRHAGRGGLGAVLGAKNVKAVAVRPRTKVAPADPAGVLAAAKDLRTRSFGAATAKYRELGTLANLLAFNALSTLPTRNFQAATFDGAPALAAEELAELRGTRPQQLRLLHDRLRAHLPALAAPRRHARCGSSTRTSSRSARCAGCPTPTTCSRRAPGATTWASTPSRRAARSPGRWSAPSAACSTPRGCGSATAPRCCARSTRSAAAPGSGRCSRWARGGRRPRSAGGSADFAPHVKGLEMPGYEPRTLHAMALGLAVNARGADHNRSGAYEADLGGDLDRLDGGPAHVAAAVETEDRAAVMDSLILCKFLRGVFTDPFAEWAELLSAGHRLGRRRRRAARDRPPDRAGQARLQHPRGLAARGRLAAGPAARRDRWSWPPGAPPRSPPERLRAMVDGYWAARGLDAQRLPQDGDSGHRRRTTGEGDHVTTTAHCAGRAPRRSRSRSTARP